MQGFQTTKTHDKTILEQGRSLGIEQGRSQGIEQGIMALIIDNLEDGKTKEVIISKLEKRFELSKEDAEEYFEKYTKKTV